MNSYYASAYIRVIDQDGNAIIERPGCYFKAEDHAKAYAVTEKEMGKIVNRLHPHFQEWHYSRPIRIFQEVEAI